AHWLSSFHVPGPSSESGGGPPSGLAHLAQEMTALGSTASSLLESGERLGDVRQISGVEAGQRDRDGSGLSGVWTALERPPGASHRIDLRGQVSRYPTVASTGGR